MNDLIQLLAQLRIGKDTLRDVLRIIDPVYECFFAEKGDDSLLYLVILRDDSFGLAVAVINGKTLLA